MNNRFSKLTIIAMMFASLSGIFSLTSTPGLAAAGAELRASAPARAIKWNTDLVASLSEAQSQGKLLLVDVNADWCGWCHRMNNETYADSQVIGYLSRDFVCVKVDADTEQGSELMEMLGIDGVPAVVVIDPADLTCEIKAGFAVPDQFIANLMDMTRRIVASKQAPPLSWE